MSKNEKAKTLYDDIVNCSLFAKHQAIATQLSELIHCHKHRKVGDGYVLSILCAMRNAIWDSEDSDNSYWHTGTPTKEGEYLIKYRCPQNGMTHDVAQYPASVWEMNIIEKWQKIEETDK